jgi:hypothetical protein
MYGLKKALQGLEFASIEVTVKQIDWFPGCKHNYLFTYLQKNN